jgi:ribose transport system substrate-binding protein
MMPTRQHRRRRRLLTCLVACAAIVGLTAACSSSSGGGSSTPSSSGGGASSSSGGGTSSSGSASSSGSSAASGPEAATQAAAAQIAIAEKGRFTHPPTTSSPAVKGKNVWILESSGAAPSVAIPAQAAAEAGKALGWKTTIYDAKGLPSNYTQGVSNAIANGAQGIVLVAIDCSYVKNQLQQAKSKGIAVSEVYAFDCSETNPGSPSLFSADLNFGTRFPSLLVAWQGWGSDTAAYIIMQQKGKADALVLDTDQVAVLVSYDKGVYDRIAECSSCKTTKVKWDVVTQGTPAALTSLIQSAVLKNPGINGALFGSTVTSGFNQAILALGSKGKNMTVVGGLGLADEFNLLKAQKGLNATTAWPQQWIAYAAMDSINSVFANKKTEDEGIGWRIVDQNNLSQQVLDNGIWNGVDNFRDLYKTRWGVS